MMKEAMFTDAGKFVMQREFRAVPEALRQYLATAVLPRYDEYDKAHSQPHIRGVMLRSMELCEALSSGKMSRDAPDGQNPSEVVVLDPAMVMVIAAYHDIGICEGRERHHISSGRMLMEDTALRQWFSERQLETMKEAVEDHRSSNRSEPRSIYGRIVSEADKEIDIDTIISRTILYGLSNFPDLSGEEQLERSFSHLQEKYGDGGYLRLQFRESSNARRLEELRCILRDRERTNAELAKFEIHPLRPFVPSGAKVLLLGSFPPPRAKWSMDFFYPNFQNDMWRIMGLLFHGDRNHFVASSGRGFDYDRVVRFCTEQGIALYDAAYMVKRLKGNASDNFLKIIVPSDIPALLRSMPGCRAVVSTGGKSAEQIAEILSCPVPPVGGSVPFSLPAANAPEHELTFYRMPSSSRAYPMPLEQKAEYYSRLFLPSSLEPKILSK